MFSNYSQKKTLPTSSFMRSNVASTGSKMFMLQNTGQVLALKEFNHYDRINKQCEVCMKQIKKTLQHDLIKQLSSKNKLICHDLQSKKFTLKMDLPQSMNYEKETQLSEPSFQLNSEQIQRLGSCMTIDFDFDNTDEEIIDILPTIQEIQPINFISVDDQ